VAIYDPIPILEPRRRKLLVLLAKLLDESLDDEPSHSNRPAGKIVLTDSERQELRKLLSELASDRSFVVAVTFVDGLAGRSNLTESELREIYLSERRKRGRKRALASMHWADFLARLGRTSGPIYSLKSTDQMSFDYFHRMEERLFQALGFSQRVTNYLLRKISNTKPAVEAARDPLGEGLSPKRSLLAESRAELERLEMLLHDKISGHNVSVNRIASMTTVVSNLSVLFTTRDWSVAGFMSVIAGESIKSFDR